MTKTTSSSAAWMGSVPGSEIAGERAAFNDGMLWIGQHASDQDLLVFDPAESDPSADPVAFYSLTQHRQRTFPRSVVRQRIPGLADDISRRRAQHDYENRAALRQQHLDAAAEAQAARMDRQRQNVCDAHRRYVEAIGVEYLGTSPTPATHRPGRRSKCHVCALGLDDFASAVCGVCSGVLCSCGACACRAARPQEEDGA